MGMAEDRIRELAQDLTPVRPIPPLRAALAAAVAFGAVAVLAHGLLGGPGLRPAGSAVPTVPYLAVLSGLVALAFGALGAALATAVPGREAVLRLGIGVAAAGLVLALAGGLGGMALGQGLTGEESVTDCLWCIARALGLGAAPLLVTGAFLVYAVVCRPGLGTSLAIAGGVALGAAAVHVTCLIDSPKHWLVAHALAPALAALVLAAPLAALLARRVRRV